MKYIVTNINFDTDGEDCNLPNELIIEVPSEMKDSQEIDEFISNEISNETGFCHNGFSTSPFTKKDVEELVAKHEKIRSILIDNGNEEFGDCIIDEICEATGVLPTTVYYEE